MLRALDRQAVTAVPRPFHPSTSTSRQIHSLQLRVHRSSELLCDCSTLLFKRGVHPQANFASKRQKEAKNRGEFAGIHDIGTDPKDYGVLISDVEFETLEEKIAEELAILYLPKATELQAKEVVQVGNGYICGSKSRPIVPFVVDHKGEARRVFSIVDSASPLTSMTRLSVGRKPRPPTCV